MTINSRIKELRKHLDLNSRDFGAEINYSHSTVIQVEKGRCPEEKFIQAVCSKYNVSETWLRTGEGEMFSTPESDIEVAMRVIADRVKRLDPDLQQEVYGLCRRILDSAPGNNPPDKQKNAGAKTRKHGKS